MNKLIVTGMLALGAVGIFQQPALAWKNVKFGIGFNFSAQSGGNTLLWGLYRNGQPGEPDWVCTHNCGYAQPPSHPPMSFAPTYSVPNFGYPTASPQHEFQPPMPTPVPAARFGYGNQGVQPVTFGDYYGSDFSFIR